MSVDNCPVERPVDNASTGARSVPHWLEPYIRRPAGGVSSQEGCVPPRFYQLADVAEMLSISARQAYALVRSGELPAIQVGGRGQWRVEATELENYIQLKYAQTREMVRSRPSEIGDHQPAGED
jgi:excisionase family DNA binding protein